MPPMYSICNVPILLATTDLCLTQELAILAAFGCNSFLTVSMKSVTESNACCASNKPTLLNMTSGAGCC